MVNFEVGVVATWCGTHTHLPGDHSTPLGEGGLVTVSASVEDLGLTCPAGLLHEECSEVTDAQEVHEQVRPDRTMTSQGGWLNRRGDGFGDEVRLLGLGLHMLSSSLQGVGVDEH